MVSAAPSTTQGQTTVMHFMEDLALCLESEPGKVLKGTKQSIVEHVVRRSDRLQAGNVMNLTKQLLLALNAPCHQKWGVRYQSMGGNQLKVMLG